MLANNATDAEVRQGIYNLRRELKPDMGEVRAAAHAFPEIPTYAVDLYREVAKTMKKKAPRHMEGRELRNVYRDLQYIRGLKSSTLAGALETANTLEPLKRTLEGLSEETRKKVWDIYGKVLQHSADLRHFKYEIWNVMTDVAGGYASADKAVEFILEEYDKFVKGEGDYEYADDRTDLFIQNLSNLLR